MSTEGANQGSRWLPRLIGALLLLALVPVGLVADMLLMGWLTTAVVLIVSFWEARRLLRRRSAEQD